MGGKLIARKGDKHDCPLHGEGEIITGYANYLVEGQPVARVGDKIRCSDGSEAEILDNDCCMEIAGKKVARLGDKTSHGGTIISAASSTTADDQNTFIRFGSAGTVRIGKNVHFGGRAKQQSDAANVGQTPVVAENHDSTIHTNHSTNNASVHSSSKASDQIENKQNDKNMWPSAEVKVHHSTSHIGPIKTYNPPGILFISNTLEAMLTLTKKGAVNPATFNKDGFRVEAKNEAVKISSDFNVKDVHSILEEPPQLTLYNSYGEYSIELTPVFVNSQAQYFTGRISKETVTHDANWDIKGQTDMVINVIFKGDMPEGSWTENLEKEFESLKDKCVDMLEETDFVPQKLMPIVATVLSIIYVAAVVMPK